MYINLHVEEHFKCDKFHPNLIYAMHNHAYIYIYMVTVCDKVHAISTHYNINYIYMITLPVEDIIIFTET